MMSAKMPTPHRYLIVEYREKFENAQQYEYEHYEIFIILILSD